MTSPFVPVKQGNAQESAIQKILKQGVALASSTATVASTTASSVISKTTSLATPETSNYLLKVVFYFLLFALSIFIILLLVHYTYKPIFQFVPGGKGIIPIPGVSDDKVYWNTKKQPSPENRVPLLTDEDLASYPFINNFSFSVDIFLRKIIQTTSTNRLILYKTHRYGTDVGTTNSISTAPSSTNLSITNMLSYYSSKASMILYIDESNNLILTFFSGPSATQISSRPIQNVPIGIPFRISCVVEEKTITLYLNGKQVSQIVKNSPLSLNTSNSLPSNTQHFYSAPSWTNLPSKSIYVQNLHIWPRPLTHPEVENSSPALARKEDFDLPKEELNQQCAN